MLEKENVSYRKFSSGFCTEHSEKARGIGYQEEISPTLRSGTVPATNITAIAIENHPADSRVKICEDEIFQTLSSRMGTGGGNTPMVMESVCIENGQVAQTEISNKVGTLNCMHDQQEAKVYAKSVDTSHADSVARITDVVPCMQGRQVHGGNNVQVNSIVRRLTPLECERLQGYPDGWTDIGEWTDSKGKKHKDSDSPRYKALGNSIALPFWEWMADRMVKQLKADGVESPTMASLFDGIGGFPLVYSRCGCEPVWASEIEEFPIAVTKIRFPDEVI